MARLVAVTACPTGIAHTFMAAEALRRAAQAAGHTLRAETPGSVGAQDALTPQEIADADAVILAAASAGAAWWVWVAGGAPSAIVTVTSATTTGQATAALDAVLLSGPASVAWTGAAVLLAVAVFSLLAVIVAGRPRARR